MTPARARFKEVEKDAMLEQRKLCARGGTIVLASYIMIIGAMLEKQWRVECVPGGVPTLLRRLAAAGRWPQMLLFAMI